MSEFSLTAAFQFLDDLRESGSFNMLAVLRYVQNEFEITETQARVVTGMWRDTFNSSLSLEERVTRAQLGAPDDQAV